MKIKDVRVGSMFEYTDSTTNKHIYVVLEIINGGNQMRVYNIKAGLFDIFTESVNDVLLVY